MPQELSANTEAEILEECQNAISYRFTRTELLRAALTHTSGADTRLSSNERLEFLGDAVLGLVTVEQLYLRFPEYQEGDLTKIKSAVVSRRTCARIAKALNLGDYLFLGRGMHVPHDAAMPSNLLADGYESLLGAIFLDGGLESAREFILRYVGPEIADGLHLDRPVVLRTLQLSFNLIEPDWAKGKPLAWMSPEVMAKSQEVLFEYGGVKKKLPIEDYFTNQFVPTN